MGPFLFELLPSSEIYLYGYGAFDGADNEERSLDTKAGHITLGEWTHIVVTFTRESLKIYQNGLLVSSKLGCFRNDHGEPGCDPLKKHIKDETQSRSRFFVGTRGEADEEAWSRSNVMDTVSTGCLDGAIKSLRFWHNKELTEGEVGNL